MDLVGNRSIIVRLFGITRACAKRSPRRRRRVVLLLKDRILLFDLHDDLEPLFCGDRCFKVYLCSYADVRYLIWGLL